MTGGTRPRTAAHLPKSQRQVGRVERPLAIRLTVARRVAGSEGCRFIHTPSLERHHGDKVMENKGASGATVDLARVSAVAQFLEPDAQLIIQKNRQ